MSRGPRREIALNAGAMAFFLGTFVSMPFVSRFAVSLGASSVEVSMLGPAFSLAGVILRPVCGLLLDRGYLKRLIYSGLVCSVTAHFAYALASSVVHLYVGRVIHGVGFALFVTSSIYTATLAGEKAAEFIAWRSTMVGLGMALGPAIGGFLARVMNYRELFYVAALVVTAAIPVHGHALRGLRIPRATGYGGSSLRDLLVPGFLAASTSIFTYSAFYNSLLLFLPALHEMLGVPAEFTGLAFTAASFTNLLSRVLFTGASKKAPVTALASAGHLLVLLGSTLVAWNTHTATLHAYMGVVGFGGGLLIPAIQVMATLSVRERSRGLAIGFFAAIFESGNLCGPPLAMAIGGDYENSLKAAALLNAIGSLTLLLHHSLRERGDEKPFSSSLRRGA